MNKAKVAALIAGLKPSPPGPRITFDKGASEIAEALKIPYAAATMTLYGLCAIGDVRWVDISGAMVEEDELTVANFSGKPAIIDADDLRAWLVTCSHAVQLSQKEKVISLLIADGDTPRKLGWKRFCDRVRDACNGRGQRGFSEKQIRRLVNGLGQK
jgi:hypothetical protein